MILQKSTYYHVMVMWVNLKGKQGLVYNCLHVEVKICVGRTVEHECKRNHFIETVSILESTYLWQIVHIFVADTCK